MTDELSHIDQKNLYPCAGRVVKVPSYEEGRLLYVVEEVVSGRVHHLEKPRVSGSAIAVGDSGHLEWDDRRFQDVVFRKPRNP